MNSHIFHQHLGKCQISHQRCDQSSCCELLWDACSGLLEMSSQVSNNGSEKFQKWSRLEETNWSDCKRPVTSMCCYKRVDFWGWAWRCDSNKSWLVLIPDWEPQQWNIHLWASTEKFGALIKSALFYWTHVVVFASRPLLTAATFLPAVFLLLRVLTNSVFSFLSRISAKSAPPSCDFLKSIFFYSDQTFQGYTCPLGVSAPC